MTVASILRGKPQRVIGLRETQSVAEAAQLLAKENIGAVLVTGSGGDMIGIVSERDIVRAMASKGAGVVDQPVASLMTKDVTCCAPEDSVASTMALMTERRFRHLPVRKDGKIIGMISIGDVVKRRVEDAESEAMSLRDYIVNA